jgi:hypothetical protein
VLRRQKKVGWRGEQQELRTRPAPPEGVFARGRRDRDDRRDRFDRQGRSKRQLVSAALGHAAALASEAAERSTSGRFIPPDDGCQKGRLASPRRVPAVCLLPKRSLFAVISARLGAGTRVPLRLLGREVRYLRIFRPHLGRGARLQSRPGRGNNPPVRAVHPQPPTKGRSWPHGSIALGFKTRRPTPRSRAGWGCCTDLVAPTPAKTTEEGRWCLTAESTGAPGAETSH